MSPTTSTFRRRFGITTAALAVLLGTGSCGPPCEQDAFNCGEGNGFSFDDSCSLDGSLDVALGQGRDRFELLSEGEEPELHFGNQGLQHMFLAVQVGNPALEYPLIKVRLEAAVNDPCDEPDCDPWVITAQREVVVGPELPLDGSGNVAQTGLLLVLGIWPQDFERRIRLEVVDSCRREGGLEHQLLPR